MEWLGTVSGQNLLEQERRLTGQALESVFGDQIVQIGGWGTANALMSQARTQFAVVLNQQAVVGVGALTSPTRLGVRSDSVDAVLLPHTLEFSDDAHTVLREVHRVLRPDGRLIVLGFNPRSWWGLRNRFSRGYPPGARRHVSAPRLSDWLRLLSIRVDSVDPVYARPPRHQFEAFMQRSGCCASAYLLMATKETVPMTVIRPRLSRAPRLVGSLVNPSTRNVA